jgi:hypothetical protein
MPHCAGRGVEVVVVEKKRMKMYGREPEENIISKFKAQAKMLAQR